MESAPLLEHIDENEVIEIARRLQKFRSFSGEEQAVATDYAEQLESLGLEVELQEAEPGRPNVIAKLPGFRRGSLAHVQRTYRHRSHYLGHGGRSLRVQDRGWNDARSRAAKHESRSGLDGGRCRRYCSSQDSTKGRSDCCRGCWRTAGRDRNDSSSEAGGGFPITPLFQNPLC